MDIFYFYLNRNSYSNVQVCVCVFVRNAVTFKKTCDIIVMLLNKGEEYEDGCTDRGVIVSVFVPPMDVEKKK